VSEPVVVENPAESRYELRLDDGVAGFVVYRDAGGRRVLVHTEVDPAHEGEGLGGRLAAGTLDAARAAGLSIVPSCPFIRSYIRRHPEYDDLVAS
jgi:predicted GNAT family acetyltransferase